MSLAILTLLAGSAMASQSYDPSDYSGTYNLACEDASLTLHVGLTGLIGGADGSWEDTFEVPLDCDGVAEADLDALEDEITAGCESLGFDSSSCASFGQDTADAVADFNDGAIAYIPVRARFTVYNTTNWLCRLLGIYPVRGRHLWADGTKATWGYLINNNDGGSLGDFATADAAILDSGTVGTLGCADLVLGAVSGNIDPASSYDVEVDFAIDRSMVCAAYSGSDFIVAEVGLTFDGSVRGFQR